MANKGNAETREFLTAIEHVDSIDYLKEFLMAEYDNLLIPESNDKLNMDGYRNWSRVNPTVVDVKRKFFTIAYEK